MIHNCLVFLHVRGDRNAGESAHSAQFTLMIHSNILLIPTYFEDKWISHKNQWKNPMKTDTLMV